MAVFGFGVPIFVYAAPFLTYILTLTLLPPSCAVSPPCLRCFTDKSPFVGLNCSTCFSMQIEPSTRMYLTHDHRYALIKKEMVAADVAAGRRQKPYLPEH